MRALLIIFILWSTAAVAQEQLLANVRQNIGEVFKTDTVCMKIHEAFEKTDISSNNLLLGYKGAVEMGMARHHPNVFKKMGFFNDGKDQLEKSIEKDPENLELRFLRLTIQTNLPTFLGYGESKEKDKSFVLANLESSHSAEFKKRVRGFIKHAEEQGKL
jgi:hypothetical protein